MLQGIPAIAANARLSFPQNSRNGHGCVGLRSCGASRSTKSRLKKRVRRSRNLKSLTPPRRCDGEARRAICLYAIPTHQPEHPEKHQVVGSERKPLISRGRSRGRSRVPARTVVRCAC